MYRKCLSEIAYKALPAALVDKVKVDVGDMKVGDTIRVKDLEIAKDKEIDLSHRSGSSCGNGNSRT